VILHKFCEHKFPILQHQIQKILNPHWRHIVLKQQQQCGRIERFQCIAQANCSALTAPGYNTYNICCAQCLNRFRLPLHKFY